MRTISVLLSFPLFVALVSSCSNPVTNFDDGVTGINVATTIERATTASSSVHLSLGVPRKITAPSDYRNDYLLVKPQYALSYNNAGRVPNWVSWKTDKTDFGSVPRFSGNFITETAFPSGFTAATHSDYTGSGYDRGHMVRSEERTVTSTDNRSTFYTSNILPQFHDLNGGPWLRLEEYVQSLAQGNDKALYQIAGGIYSSSPSKIGTNKVWVPQSTWKIVVVLNRTQSIGSVTTSTRVIAVKMPNAKGIIGQDWKSYRVSVDSIEAQTGYDFLTDVPTAVQNAIEAKIDSQ